MKQQLLFANILLCIFASNLLCVTAQAQCRNAKPLPGDLTEIGLEKLLSFDIEVTSASKKAQRFGNVASAIYVLTGEDIRRSGAVHITDVLRLVPGVQVAQIDGGRWAVTARGLNSSFARELLVLIDGQSVFTPAFNGVFWDQQELMLENIDRVEVIRGPGATVWGSNAVNGVINIITCNAEHTLGTSLSAGGGSSELFNSSGTYGGQLGEKSFYRVYGKHRRRDNNKLSGGGDSLDELQTAAGGARLDTSPTELDLLTFTADGFYVDREMTVTAPSLSPPLVDTDSFSGNKRQYGTRLLGNWDHTFSDHSDLTFQLDYIFEKQKDLPVFPLDRHTLHLDLRHRFVPFSGSDTIIGFEYRANRDKIEGSFVDDFDPEKRSTNLYTWFLQDDITLIDDTLHLILGSKFEKNQSTGLEYMPNVRAVVAPNDKHTLWAAVSRAVANPSRVFEDVTLPLAAFPEPMSGLTAVPTLRGNRDVKAEDLTAYELGYRTESLENFTFDLALFYNDYDDFISAEQGAPFVGNLRNQPGPALIIPLDFSNKLSVESYGAEFALEYHPTTWMRLVGSYSHININVQLTKESTDVANIGICEGTTPENQFNLRSYIDLPRRVEFDTVLRYTDHLSYGGVDSFLELDLRLSWNPTDNIELTVAGLNLIENSHQEFQGIILPPPAVEVERSVFGKITWTF